MAGQFAQAMRGKGREEWRKENSSGKEILVEVT